MKNFLYLVLSLFAFMTSCQKREWTNLYDPNNTLEKTLPAITGKPALVATFNTAITGGSIASAGVYPITERGVCWSTTSSPTIANSKTTNGTGTGSYTDSIKGLSNNITYYVRAYATNAIGTAYGNEYSVILYMNVPDASITDIDGNVYKTVKIGTQVWMAENLKVTKYRNGVAIPNVTDGTIWKSLASGAWCDFSNSVTNGATYGHLYNFYSVIDSRQLSPTGWHVPSDSEWSVLREYLGGVNVAGNKLKETGIAHWDSPNTGADNSSGFTALAGSWRGLGGLFYYHVGSSAIWYTSTITNNPTNPLLYSMWSGPEFNRSTDPYFPNDAGCSVRCIKD